MGKNIDVNHILARDYIRINSSGTISDDVTKLNIKHYRFYMPTYKYGNNYYVDNIHANKPIGIREYLVDILICSEVTDLRKVFREERLSNLLD